MPHKVAIGTVQFGLTYGISNKKGQTTRGEVSRILSVAKKYGVDTLDTAYAYGDSEEVLGEVGVDDFQIISKFPPVEEGKTPKTYLEESLQRLKKTSLEGYLAHRCQDFIDYPNLWNELQELKAAGKVKKTGYSLYNPAELESLLSLGFQPDIVQVPFSVLDKRFLPYLGELKKKGCEVHTRSAFLQGLFFMEPEELSAFFNPVKPFLSRLKAGFADKAQRAAYLLKCCWEQENIDKVVVGVNNVMQLETNLTAASTTGDLPAVGFEPVKVPEDILLPYNWKQ